MTPKDKNTERAESALDAVYEHTDFASEPPRALPTYVGDLLCNLMHLCRKRKIDFEKCLMTARGHFQTEVAEETT